MPFLACGGIDHLQDSGLAPLPLGDSFQGVAISRQLAAITFEQPSVLLLRPSGDAWLPAGEVRSRAVATTAAFEGDHLLLGSKDGALALLANGEATPLAPPLKGHTASCKHQQGLARLVMTQGRPELYLS